MATKRKAISTRTRFEIFKRDGFACQYCGATPPAVLLHVDHITAVKNGGDGSQDNLITACEHCNLGKAAVPLSSIPKSLKDKSAETAEREEQIRGYNAILLGKKNRIDDEAWAVARVLEHDSELDSYDRKRLVSIRMFLERMPFAEVLSSAERTAAKFPYTGSGAFRWFCGACWGKIKAQPGAHA